MTDSSIKFIDNDLGTQVPQITVVGFEFEAGPKGNAQIAEAYGHHVATFPTGEFHKIVGEHVMCPLADYCDDLMLSLDSLEERGVIAIVLPTEKPKGARKYEPGFCAAFDLAGSLHVTSPQPTEAAAAAAALWFVLTVSHD